MKPVSLKFVYLKIILWIPICFAVWYFAFPVLLFISSTLSQFLLPFISNNIISTTQLNANHLSLDIITNFVDLTPNDPEGKRARMAITINVMKYGFGLPLFIASVLAIPGSLQMRVQNVLICILLVVVVQLLGITFEVYKDLYFHMGTKVTNHMAPSRFLQEFIKFGYLLATLILPAVAPMTLFFILFKKHYYILKGNIYIK